MWEITFNANDMKLFYILGRRVTQANLSHDNPVSLHMIVYKINRSVVCYN